MPTDGLLSYFSISFWFIKFVILCVFFRSAMTDILIRFFVHPAYKTWYIGITNVETVHHSIIRFLFIISIVFTHSPTGGLAHALVLNTERTASTFQSPTTERYLLRLLNETDIWNKCDNINFYISFSPHIAIPWPKCADHHSKERRINCSRIRTSVYAKWVHSEFALIWQISTKTIWRVTQIEEKKNAANSLYE